MRFRVNEFYAPVDPGVLRRERARAPFTYTRRSRMIHRAVVLAALTVVPFVPVAGAETERAPSGRHQEKAAVTDHPAININTADVKSLMTLDGVGRKVAEKIVEYREAHGPFKKPDDVRKVDGIGGGLWERNRERIVVK